MDSEQTGYALNSAFFVLNIREERMEQGHVEWHGELLHVDSGQVVAFADWPEMVESIAEALHALRPQVAALREA